MNRLIGIFALIFCLPIIILSTLIVYLHDLKNPLYIHYRIGLNGNYFKVFKIRSMKKNNGSPNFLATAKNDPRIFPFGSLIRKYKIDELPQFLNLAKGDVKIYGPRPNLPKLVEDYTIEELELLKFKPGITDLSSLILMDYNKVLAGKINPDIFYKEKIKPLKYHLIKLGLEEKLYGKLIVIFSTFIGIFNVKLAKKIIFKLLKNGDKIREIENIVYSAS